MRIASLLKFGNMTINIKTIPMQVWSLLANKIMFLFTTINVPEGMFSFIFVKSLTRTLMWHVACFLIVWLTEATYKIT